MRALKAVMLGPCIEEHRKYSSIAIYTNKLTNCMSYMENIELHIITIGDKNIQFKERKSNVNIIKKLTYYPLYLPSAVMHLKRKIMEMSEAGKEQRKGSRGILSQKERMMFLKR